MPHEVSNESADDESYFLSGATSAAPYKQIVARTESEFLGNSEELRMLV